MTEAKYTPVEVWYYAQREGVILRSESMKMIPANIITQIHPGRVLEHPSSPEKDANGYLIAAAPELLEACQAGLSFVEAWISEHSLDSYPPSPRGVAALLQAAIAKAKGEK